MKTLLALLLALSIPTTAHADVKISQLPLGSAAAADSSDVFPYVDVSANATKKMTLWDLVNLPIMVTTFAPNANPNFTGNVTVQSLTANRVVYGNGSKVLASSATTNTQLEYLSTASGITGFPGNVVGSASPTIASPSLTGNSTGVNLTLSGTIAIGSGASLSAGDLVYAQESFTNPSGATRGGRITPRVAAIIGPNANYVAGILSLPAILGTNTQNWTTTSTPGLMSFYADYRTLTGAAGTLSFAAGLYSRLQNSGSMTVTANHGAYMDNPINSGTLTGNSGLTVANQTTGTNNTNLLLGTGTIPTGNYSIFSASSYESSLAGPLRLAPGISNGLIIGSAATNSTSTVKLLGSNSTYNWQLDTASLSAGLTITPSSATGGTTFTDFVAKFIGGSRTPLQLVGNSAGSGFLYVDSTSFGLKTEGGSFTTGTAFIGVDTGSSGNIRGYTSNTLRFVIDSTGDAQFRSGGSQQILMNSSLAGVPAQYIKFQDTDVANTQRNWVFGVNFLTNGSMEWIPSTAAAGNTFSTAAMSLTSAGNWSVAGTATATKVIVGAASGSLANFYGASGGTTGLLGVGISSVTNGLLVSTDASNNITLSFANKNADIIFRTDSVANVVIGSAANGTTATAGFLYIPTSAGLPTGVPSQSYAGRLPFQYDSTNKKLCVYDAGWRCTVAF